MNEEQNNRTIIIYKKSKSNNSGRGISEFLKNINFKLTNKYTLTALQLIGQCDTNTITILFHYY